MIARGYLIAYITKLISFVPHIHFKKFILISLKHLMRLWQQHYKQAAINTKQVLTFWPFALPNRESRRPCGKNYEAVETAKTELLVRQQQEKVAKKEEEIIRVRATIQAEQVAEVARIYAEKMATISKINAEREIIQKEAKKKKRFIDDQIALHQKNMRSDAEFYQIVRSAEANKQLYTEEFLRFSLYSSIEKKCEVIFRGKITRDLYRYVSC